MRYLTNVMSQLEEEEEDKMRYLTNVMSQLEEEQEEEEDKMRYLTNVMSQLEEEEEDKMRYLTNVMSQLPNQKSFLHATTRARGACWDFLVLTDGAGAKMKLTLSRSYRRRP